MVIEGLSPKEPYRSYLIWDKLYLVSLTELNYYHNFTDFIFSASYK